MSTQGLLRADPAPAAAGRALTAALAIGAALLSLPPLPARADRPDSHDRRHDDERHERAHQRPRHYRYPVYAPPPVYYPRHESPGISIFFPIEIH